MILLCPEAGTRRKVCFWKSVFLLVDFIGKVYICGVKFIGKV